MAFDVTTHRLVPKHEVLGDEEKQKVLQTYNILLPALPEIDINDPALAKLKAKSGDVIRITRQSLTAKHSVFYRRVVSHE